jgi:enediyne biosynthesis protein E4
MIQRTRSCLFFSCTISLFFALQGCHTKTVEKPLFETIDYSKSGLDFVNKLTPTSKFNVFDYMYFYNGSGVGSGDFNNDGLIDVFFSSNQGDNKLYLNMGNLQFKDVTSLAMIPQDGAWSTGVSVVDINNDGMLDIYICRVGNHSTLTGHNQLLVCQGIDNNGIPTYREEAHEYGLDFSGFSSQAVFFDFDMDGDLDMFLMNHTVRQNGTFGGRDSLLTKFNPLSGDRMYRNDNNKFTDITSSAGIYNSILGFGLGVCVADIDLDGHPDIYVGNDFNENDYLYINQKNGTFKEDITNRMMHTSQYTMGVDIADANNDGYPDIISMDMMPYDPYILKRSEGKETYDIFNMKLGLGYNYQYSRNNLQFNRKNGLFSEIGQYSNVFATDWSWSPLWMDFDNDGLKDLFVTNGIPVRLNDIDFINFISNLEIQSKILNQKVGEKDMALIDKFPQIKIKNRFFSNAGDFVFNDAEDQVIDNRLTFSNGAIYADLDNDGDLDIVVNNIDDPALLYKNRSNDQQSRPYAELILKGSKQNVNAIGAKVIVYANGGMRVYEKNPIHGFLSSSEGPVHIGLYNTKVDSAFLIWPDNSFQPIQFSNIPRLIFSYKEGLPKFDYSTLAAFAKSQSKPMEDITNKVHLQYKHQENSFDEFSREPLMPHMLSTEGPALAVADINHDGLQDLYIGASRNKKPAIFIQGTDNGFYRSQQPALEEDSAFEDVDACWADVNNDGNPDLVVASGGNEFIGQDPLMRPRIYLNDGKAHFSKAAHAFDSVFVNASCVVADDFNGDGAVDLFIGGRSVPNHYGQVPRSYLLQNDGKGRFTDVTEQYAKELAEIGFVTKAIWFDMDNNGEKDLVLCLEWGGIIAFLNHHGKFTKKVLTDLKGWWNFILPVDLNHDGNIDLIAGNLGLNNMLKASEKEPVKMYYQDFGGSGKKEQVITYYFNHREIPFANKDELEKQMPGLKKKFLYAADFAKASLEELFGADQLAKAKLFSADYFANAVLMNQGNLEFKANALPWEAQLSTFRDAVVVDANGDSLPDILLMGNYYENNLLLGRNDADFGTVLLNRGKGNFSAEGINGLNIKGQVRHVSKIDIGKSHAFVLAKNNDSLQVIRFKDPIKNTSP